MRQYQAYRARRRLHRPQRNKSTGEHLDSRWKIWPNGNHAGGPSSPRPNRASSLCRLFIWKQPRGRDSNLGQRGLHATPRRRQHRVQPKRQSGQTARSWPEAMMPQAALTRCQGRTVVVQPASISRRLLGLRHHHLLRRWGFFSLGQNDRRPSSEDRRRRLVPPNLHTLNENSSPTPFIFPWLPLRFGRFSIPFGVLEAAPRQETLRGQSVGGGPTRRSLFAAAMSAGRQAVVALARTIRESTTIRYCLTVK